MSLAISPDLEQFVVAEITSGRFASREAVIAHALRLLQRDRAEAVQGICAGLDDAAAGRLQPLEEAFNELRGELNIARHE